LKQEDDLLRHADLGFANGRALLQLKNRYGNLANVPMCADFELFSKSRLPETKVPEDLRSVPHPRIGLVGNINDKIDLRLLLELSAACPDYSFVLIGPVGIRMAETQANFESLKKLPNVFWLGFKQRELLPNYIKGLDVCLMCYRTDGWAYYVYPLKLHEYLASGKPTIGSGLVSLKDFDGVIRVAETPAQWLDAIREAVADRDPVRAQERIDVAHANRLEERVKLIEAAIEQKLAEKKSRGKVQLKPSP
jgi:glycosyltransferase involved in cell wall biosynthesis